MSAGLSPSVSLSLDADFLALQRAVAGEYSIERELGRGGMGAVYLAREVRLDRLVALKLLPQHLTAVPGTRERFLREARIVAQLSHPNIVPIHRVEERNGLVFFAMAYVEGETLAALLQRVGRLEAPECVRVLKAIAYALAEAHRCGVVHRDVKPENILIERHSGRPMVVDFGIARTAAGTGAASESATQEGTILGTARFMSPEQCCGLPVDARSDIYSLGVVGYLSASGRFPFEGGNAAEALAKQLTEIPPRLRTIVPSLPPRLALVIERCLARLPTDRFQAAHDLALAFEDLTAPNIGMPPALRVWLGGREVRFPVASVTVYLLVILVMLSAQRGQAVPAQMWIAGIAIPVVYRVWVRLASLRGLLKQGIRLEDLQRGRRELARERLDAEAALGTLPGSKVVLEIVATIDNFIFVGMGIIRGTRAMSSVASTFWDGPVARAMVQVLSYRLPARSGATAYAPRRTEVLVCESVLSAFDALQKPLRDSLPALPAIVRNLEKRLLGLRARLEELDVMLADLSGGEALATQLSTEALPKRSTDGVQRLTALRLECECQLVRAIGALEQLRIGLMLLRVGSGDAEGLEEDLKRAEELSLQLERLLSGQREVTELLARDVGE